MTVSGLLGIYLHLFHCVKERQDTLHAHTQRRSAHAPCVFDSCLLSLLHSTKYAVHYTGPAYCRFPELNSVPNLVSTWQTFDTSIALEGEAYTSITDTSTNRPPNTRKRKPWVQATNDDLIPTCIRPTAIQRQQRRHVTHKSMPSATAGSLGFGPIGSSIGYLNPPCSRVEGSRAPDSPDSRTFRHLLSGSTHRIRAPQLFLAASRSMVWGGQRSQTFCSPGPRYQRDTNTPSGTFFVADQASSFPPATTHLLTAPCMRPKIETERETEHRHISTTK